MPPGLVLDSRERARSDETDHGRRASPIPFSSSIPLCGVLRFNFAVRKSLLVPSLFYFFGRMGVRSR